MLYQIANGTVSAGGQIILSHINFEIKGKEKIAIVGRNGAGKTTLLKLIAGELDLDRDDKRMGPGIQCSRKLTVGMLRQNNNVDSTKTVEEILIEGCPEVDKFSKERFAYEMEYDRLFTGFGFGLEDKKRSLSSFSGGEQTKIALIRLLLMKPDILLLDEPTNHLDIKTVEWLEDYMTTYDRAVVFVSHDRFFLDQVVDVVYELHNGGLKRYAGNYTEFRKQKLKDIEIQKKQYEKQQAEVKRLNELIEKFKNKPKKAAFARSRKTILERMEMMGKPDEDEAHIFTGEIIPKVAGSKWVYEAEHLKIGYDRALLELSIRIKRGQKIGIIGENGVGKSTFLKTVAGIIPGIDGKGDIGNNILMGYFDQHTADIDTEESVADHFHNMFPAMTEKDVRHTLGAYLFGGKEASKRICDLSGGEKSRLMLCELITSQPNFMLLDEPTNHMDIKAKETLESAFKAYKGTLLFVSHDRYFIKQVADAILVFEKDHVLYYPFGYQHYIERSRKNQDGELSAMIQAEHQAMIADLRAVPKGEKHRLKELSTEEAYLDWRLGLIKKPMNEARDKTELLWEQIRDAEDTLLEIKIKKYHYETVEPENCEMLKTIREELEELGSKLEELTTEYAAASDEWTSQCLEWYKVLCPEEDEL